MCVCVCVDTWPICMRMHCRIEDAIDVHAELLCDREHYIEAVKESQDSATHQHEELELLCAQLVARQQYMQVSTRGKPCLSDHPAVQARAVVKARWSLEPGPTVSV